MNADGSGLLRLTDNPGPDVAPAWAPDGQGVAFVAEAEGVEQLFLMRPDGAERRQITSLPAGARWPTWSPDGTRVAFDIYVKSVQGGGVVRMTVTAEHEQFPRWRPR